MALTVVKVQDTKWGITRDKETGKLVPVKFQEAIHGITLGKDGK